MSKINISKILGVTLLAGLLTLCVNAYAQEEAYKEFIFAQGLYEDGKFGLATVQFQKFIENFPENRNCDRAQYLLGACFWNQEKYEEAISAFDRLLQKYPESDWVDDSLYQVGENYYRLRNYAEAIPYYERLIDNFPQSNLVAPSLYSLGCAYLEQQEYNSGLRAFKKLRDEFPEFRLERKVKKKTEERVSIKDQIAFVPMKKDQEYFIPADKFKVKFKENGKKTGVVIFEYNRDDLFWNISIKRGDGSIARITDAFPSFITEVGTVDLSGTGNEHVFFVTESGGTGGHGIDLNLINTQKGEIVGLSLWFSSQTTEAITEISTTDNFRSKDFQRERKFLESIKYDYGFIGEGEANKQSNNPDFAYYFWAKDNRNIEDGKMRIRRYKGKHRCIASIADELKEHSVVYTAYFKGGVVAYDESSDEHFIVFHPDDMYSWPIVLKKTGPYLLIGTRGEGLTIVNVETFHLKRFRLHPPNDVVRKLQVLDSKIRINDSKEIDLPNF